jgi:hypothetical protein
VTGIDNTMKKTNRLTQVAITLAFATVYIGQAAASVVVTPSNMDGWALYQTDNGGIINAGSGTGSAGMVNGPATPPLGTGSANLMTGPNHGDESAQLRNSSWAGTRLDALTSLSYSTYASSWNGSQLPFLNLYINYGSGTTRDDRLWFEPTYSSAGAGNGNPSPQANVALNTWQTWNALQGMWYSESGTPNSGVFPADLNGPGDHAITLAAFIALHPNATIINDPGQGGLGGIRIADGFASTTDNFNEYVDAFTIGTAAGTTTYDFELTAVPEPTTMIAGVLLLLPFGASTLRRLRRRTA